MSGGETVYLRVRVIKDTGEALLVECSPDLNTFVLPKSQMRSDAAVMDVVDEAGDEGIVCIPRWLAEDREVEYAEAPDAC